MRNAFASSFVLLALCAPAVASAQELYEEVQGVWKAEVVEVVSERSERMAWTDAETVVQELRVELLDGERAGSVIEITNDYVPVGTGDRLYVNYMRTIDGDELYSVREIDRSVPLIAVAALFVGVIVSFGGKQGLRSLASLAVSLGAVVYLLIPALLEGYPPILTSTAIATAVLFGAIFFTHGFRRESAIAFAGTTVAVALTGLLAYVSIKWLRLTGFASDESIYLNLNTGGTLDFSGLLLGGIIIGILGVLDDIAVTQAAVVRELAAASHGKLGWKDLYGKALRVGREHVSALVNTLVLAYTGTALPLIMLVSLSGSPFSQLINQEVFATEIARTAIGSIGLVATVPLTTFLAAYWYSRRPPSESEGGHGHSHSHHHS